MLAAVDQMTDADKTLYNGRLARRNWNSLFNPPSAVVNKTKSDERTNRYDQITQRIPRAPEPDQTQRLAPFRHGGRRHARARRGTDTIGPRPEIFPLVGPRQPRACDQLGLLRLSYVCLEEWPEP